VGERARTLGGGGGRTSLGEGKPAVAGSGTKEKSGWRGVKLRMGARGAICSWDHPQFTKTTHVCRRTGESTTTNGGD